MSLSLGTGYSIEMDGTSEILQVSRDEEHTGGRWTDTRIGKVHRGVSNATCTDKMMVLELPMVKRRGGAQDFVT